MYNDKRVFTAETRIMCIYLFFLEADIIIIYHRHRIIDIVIVNLIVIAITI